MSKSKTDEIKGLLGEVDFGELVEPQTSIASDDEFPQAGNDFFDTPAFQDEFAGTDDNGSLTDDIDLELGEEDKSKKKTEKKVETTKEDLEDTTEENPPSHNDAESNSQLALVFARFLSEKGVLSGIDEEEFKEYVKENGDDAGIEYLYNTEVESRIDAVKNMYEQDVKDYIEFRDAGIDPDKAKTLSFSKSKFESITEDALEEDEELRKAVLEQHLKNTTSMSKEDIDDMVDSMVATGKDISKAKGALKAINQYNKEQIELEKKKIADGEKAQLAQREEAIKSFKSAIYEKKEVLGQTVNKQTLQKIEKFLLEPVEKDANGNPVDGITAWFMKDPVNARINLAYGIITGLLDGKIDKLKSKAKSATIKDIEAALSSKGSMLDGKSDRGADGGEGLSALKSAFRLG